MARRLAKFSLGKLLPAIKAVRGVKYVLVDLFAGYRANRDARCRADEGADNRSRGCTR